MVSPELLLECFNRKERIMRRTMLLLAMIGMYLAWSDTAFAAIEKTYFRPEPWTAIVEGGIHANLTGYVTVQLAKNGSALVTVQIQRAASNYTYVVKSLGKVIGTFRTNAKGTGSMQVTVADPNANLGRWINLWQTAGLPDGSYWGAPVNDYSDWNGHVANGTIDEFDGLGLYYGPRY